MASDSDADLCELLRGRPPAPAAAGRASPPSRPADDAHREARRRVREQLASSDDDGGPARRRRRPAVAADSPSGSPRSRGSSSSLGPPRLADSVPHARAAADELAALPPDGVLPEAPPAPPVYVDLLPTGLSDADEREVAEDPDWCYLCEVGEQTGGDDRNVRIRKLRRYLLHSYSLMSPKALTTQAQEYYNKRLRAHQDQEADRARPWYKRVIWAHLHEHHPSPQFTTMWAARVLQSAMSVLAKQGMCMASPGDNALRLDPNNTKLFMLQLRTLKPLLTETEHILASSSAHDT